MSELANLTNAGRSDVLPGFTLSPFDLADFGECEAEFSRRHLARAGEAAAVAPPSMREKLLTIASNEAVSGAFNWGRLGFNMAAHSLARLPFLLWLSLRHKHPTTILEEVAGMVTPENRDQVRRAVLELMEYKFGEKKAVAGQVNQTSPPTGEKSSDPSDAPAV